MPRSWDTRKHEEATSRGADKPAIETLQTAVGRDIGKWTVDEVRSELGGRGRDASHRLAEKLLEARGMEVNQTNIKSQMRSINRWIAYEQGTGAQARKPNEASQKMLNRIGRNASAASKGFNVAMSGDISIAGYRRSGRSADVHMQGPAAAAFLENPSFAGLSGSDNYSGLAVEAFGDVSIHIEL